MDCLLHRRRPTSELAHRTKPNYVPCSSTLCQMFNSLASMPYSKRRSSAANLRKLHWCPSKSGRSLLAQAQEERDLQLAHERLDSDTGTQFSSADVAAAAGLDRTHYPTAG
jgi:hypothetical protein